MLPDTEIIQPGLFYLTEIQDFLNQFIQARYVIPQYADIPFQFVVGSIFGIGLNIVPYSVD